MNITNSNTTTMKILTTLITMTCMSPAWTRVLPQYRVEACLLEFLFYHAPTDTCWPALERGPCAGDQWLVTSPAQPGVVECQARTRDTADCAPVILDTGEVGCREDAALDQIYTRGRCGEGERLLPDNFAMNTRPCPASHRCSTRHRTVLTAIEDLDQAAVRDLEGKVAEFLKEFVCSDNPQKFGICLPADKTSPFLKSNLQQTFKDPKLVCKKNPCPEDQEPFVNEDGFHRCRNVFRSTRFSGNLGRACKRNQIYRRNKCVSRFFG